MTEKQFWDEAYFLAIRVRATDNEQAIAIANEALAARRLAFPEKTDG